MVRYKAAYKYVEGGVHAQVLDFPAVMTCGDDLKQTRRLLSVALLDMAETRIASGESLPASNPQATDSEMDVEEPIYSHLSVSNDFAETPAGEVVSTNQA